MIDTSVFREMAREGGDPTSFSLLEMCNEIDRLRHDLNEWERGDVAKANRLMADRCVVAERETFDLREQLATARALHDDALRQVLVHSKAAGEARALACEEAVYVFASHTRELVPNISEVKIEAHPVVRRIRALAPLPPTLVAVPRETLRQLRPAVNSLDAAGGRSRLRRWDVCGAEYAKQEVDALHAVVAALSALLLGDK